eukprot:1383584-Amorphochlora_amoeboformis.AAC.1
MAHTLPRKGSKRVVFLHPDLGIGGAEKLIVEAAYALKEKVKGLGGEKFADTYTRNDTPGPAALTLGRGLGLNVVYLNIRSLTQGHSVTVCTSHYDPKRCFEKTKEMDIYVAGDWLP